MNAPYFREGDRIPTGSELYLRVVEKPGEFIHCAHRLPNPAAIREVNCALESTSWRASIFQSSLDATDPVTLLCGQLVYINDPEKNANLAIGKNKSIGLDDQSIYAGTPAIHIHDYGDIVLEPTQENKSPSSAALWLLESKKLIVGGPIAWKTQQVCIYADVAVFATMRLTLLAVLIELFVDHSLRFICVRYYWNWL